MSAMVLGLTKVRLFLQAVFSLRKGINPLATYWQRESACLGIESGESCPDLVMTNNDKTIHCGSCGCPFWPHAELRLKFLIPGATCPRKLWTINEINSN